MKVLVTGGTGFVGSRVVSALAEGGHKVIVLAHTQTSGLPGVVYEMCDLADVLQAKQVQEKVGKVDAVVHLAARIPAPDRPDTEEEFSPNTSITKNVLDIFGAGTSYVLYASTIDVYGPAQGQQYVEEQPLAPENFYARSKVAGEALVREWADQHKKPAGVLRLSQVYGPRDAGNKVIPKFIRRIREHLPLQLVAGGVDKRRYLYVDDAAAAFVQMVTSSVNGTFNVAGKEVTTVREVIELLRDVSGQDVAIEDVAGVPTGDRVMSIEKATSEWGFAPTMSLKEGLRACYAE